MAPHVQGYQWGYLANASFQNVAFHLTNSLRVVGGGPTIDAFRGYLRP
jgi:hypothetical protein